MENVLFLLENYAASRCWNSLGDTILTKAQTIMIL